MTEAAASAPLAPEAAIPDEAPGPFGDPEPQPLAGEIPELSSLELNDLMEPTVQGADVPGARPPAAAAGFAFAAAPEELRADGEAPAAAKTDERFGEYALLEKIATGGMAEVWKARRSGVEGFRKTVAIKRILSHLTGSTDFVKMFIDEAKLAAQLNHNHIIQIYDLGKEGDDFFIAMEYVDGKDLRTILQAAQKVGMPLPLGLSLLICSRLSRALDYAHRMRDFEDREMGLVHRDVSPQNVLIGFEGDIKLCDFGIVKAVAKASTTQMGALKGKLQYMSPEQAWGRSVDARSDIFSLGSVFFEMLTGTKLFTAETEIGVLDAVRDCRPRSVRDLVPSIPDEVDRIVRKALAKEPAERYQTAGEMEQDLEAALSSVEPSPGPSDLAAYMQRLFKLSEDATLGFQEMVFAKDVGSRSGPRITEELSAPAAAPGRRESAVVEAPEPAAEAIEAADAVGAAPPVAEEAVPATETVEQPEKAETTEQPEKAEKKSGGALKWLLVAAVLAALAAGAWYLYQQRGAAAPVPGEAPAGGSVPAPVDGAAASGAAAGGPKTTSDSEGLEGAAGAPANPPAQDEATGGQPAPAEDGTAAGAPPTAAAAAVPENLEEMVEQELTRRTEELRRNFEAERQRLEDEVARTRQQAEDGADTAEESPPPPPAPPGQDGGSGKRTP